MAEIQAGSMMQAVDSAAVGLPAACTVAEDTVPDNIMPTSTDAAEVCNGTAGSNDGGPGDAAAATAGVNAGSADGGNDKDAIGIPIMCRICCETIKVTEWPVTDGEVVTHAVTAGGPHILLCGHEFHQGCLAPWGEWNVTILQSAVVEHGILANPVGVSQEAS